MDEKSARGYDASGENKILLVLERAGQVSTSCIVLIFSDFNLRPFSPWSLWLFLAIILMTLYECWWYRYFRSEKKLSDFYSSFCGVPVAGAALPVAAFFLLAIYGRVIWLMISVTLLGIGHIGIHLQHRKNIGR